MEVRSKLAWVRGIEDKSIPAVNDKVFGTSAPVRDNDWESRCHGFIDDQAPGFASAGEDEASGEGIVGRQLGGASVTGEVNLISKC